MKINHPQLCRLLQKAYSAEKAASFAYIGHAHSIKDPRRKQEIKQIEADEWEHRREVLKIMKQYEIPVSKWYELKFYFIGKSIAFSCHIIGWFMPYYFAGSLESGNVCEYFVMMKYFHELEITAHDEVLYEMGMKEKEHEVYFLDVVKDSKWLPFFQKYFKWGAESSYNDVDLDNKVKIDQSDVYCKK